MVLNIKSWDKLAEKEIYEKWKSNNTYKFDRKKKGKIYSIDTPPPYINAPIHIGHATTYVIMDFFARYRRMKGNNVLFPLGLDRNGLPIEMAAEKRFKVKFNEVPREKFLEMCRETLNESGLRSIDSFLKLGIGFNSWDIGENIGDIYETDSDSYRTLTQETFIDLWEKKLIYEDDRINNWCPGCQTTIADAEISYKDIPSNFNDVVFKVKETGEDIIIGTTRPELICTCGMIIFHPDDKRYKHLNGKTAVTPLFDKHVPIKAHPMAEIEKGTGLVMMCSAGDLSDIRFFRDMNLTPVIAIDKDGRMNAHAGFLKGLKVREAREKIIETLKEKKLLVKQQKVTHRTPICERSGDEIEFISMPEFYVKQLGYKKDMKKLAKELNFYDKSSRKILLDWINSVSIDWPISRRRYYATEIPLWYCTRCNYIYVPEKGKYYKPWKEKPSIKACPKCNNTEFRGEERVFDTWFDSSISPLYILKYSRDDEFFKKAFPCSLRPQGKEIIRTWLYYTVLKDYLLTGKLIFNDVWINYHILDEKGYKMSKSEGNVIDPQEILERFGAEPFRLWAAIEGNLDSTDFRCSFERIEGAGKTINKVLNIAKFISMFELKGKHKLNELDKWIINEINELVKFSDEKYINYDFHNPAIKIKHFIWEVFASHYMELVKPRAYNSEGKFTKEEQNGAIYTLNYCLDILLKILAPVLPMITYKIYLELRNKDIHFEEFPKAGKKEKILFDTKDIIELNSKIWKYKKEKGLSLKDNLNLLEIDKSFRNIDRDITATHHVNELVFGDKFKIK